MSRWTLATVFTLSAWAGHAAADLGSKFQLNVPAEEVSQALETFAAQTHLQIVYYSDLAAGTVSPGAVGTLRADEALQKLLSGTGLTFQFLDDRTVLIRKVTEARSQSEAQGEAPAEELPAASASQLKRMRLAQSESAADLVAGEDTPVKVEEVVVTGTHLERKGDGPQQVLTFTSQDIANSGQSTVANFLATLPQVSAATGENTAQLGYGQTTVQLRGLPAGSTLVLLNGRRIGDSAGSFGSGGFFDLNLLPAGAVERIEVLPDSASAIYGSDALAGVVNIILKKDLNGGEASVRYGFANGLDERTANLAFGHQWERGGFTIIGTYFDRPDPLSGTERVLTDSKDYRAFGGPDLRSQRCDPGNIATVSGANLPGLNSSYAAIPGGIVGKPTIADFANTAGQTNLCSDLNKYVMVPQTKRYGAVMSGHFELTPNINLFAEYIYNVSQQQSADNNHSLSDAVLPASNAFNPFGVDLTVNYLFDGSQFHFANEMHAAFSRGLAGMEGDIAGWHWEVSAMRSRDLDTDTIALGNTNTAAVSAALASSDPATALNVFNSGSPGSPALLNTFYSNLRGDFDSQLDTVSAFVRGSPLRLPGGDVQVVLGADYSRETLDVNYYTIVVDAARRTSSGFTELHVPILSREHAGHQLETVAFTGAVRLDDYSDFGRQTSPQFGVEVRPLSSLLLRASYGRAFRAPGLYVLYGPSGPPYENPIVDSKRGNENVSVPATQGSNPNLRPELGKSKSVGLVWHSEQIPALNVGATYWSVDQTNRVSLVLPQTIVDDEALFPGRVQRGPSVNGMPGPITFVDDTYLNVGELDVAGVDANVDYTWHTSAGDWMPRLAVTYTQKYDEQLTPDSPTTNMTSAASTLAWSPRWRGTMTLGWKRGMFSASVDGRYVSKYVDYQEWGANQHIIGNFWLADLSASVDFGAGKTGAHTLLSHAFASLSIANVFDRLPQWSYFQFSDLGYDPSQADIIGRMAQLSVGVRW